MTLLVFCLTESYFFGYAEDAPVDQDLEAIIQNFEQYQKNIEGSWQSKSDYTKDQITKTRSALQSSYRSFQESQKKITEYEKIIAPITERIKTLEGALKMIDEQLELTQLKIKNVQIQVAEKKAEIFLLMQEIESLEIEAGNQTQIIMEYIKLLYDQEKDYYDFDAKQIDDLKLLLLNDSLANVIKTTTYTKIVEQTGRDILGKLVTAQQDLDVKKQDLEGRRQRLTDLNDRLRVEESTLQEQLAFKQQLLDESRGEEQKYQQMLSLSRLEMEASATDITMLEDHLNGLQNKLSSLEENSERAPVVSAAMRQQVQKVYNLSKENPSPAALAWPVPPSSGLSAYFEDPSYSQVFGVVHHAVDIPTGQGSKVRAPADGVVYKVKDNGLGYSYLIIAHSGNLRTVYGHISEFLVKEGDLVRQGDVVALSGGTPGTKGAGWMTTGAHLHFEVWNKGKAVDPLTYLDKSVLPGN